MKLRQNRIVIRVDASQQIGTGHVMRCLCLARQLRENGAVVAFVCRLHEGNLCDYIKDNGFTVHRLPQRSEETGKTGAVPGSRSMYERWCGSDWKTDAKETIKTISGAAGSPDWIIVDHYALDHKWEKEVRRSTGKILVIDDLADRRHECDLLLDQNLVENFQHRYETMVNDGCTLLLGPRYALLNPEYALLHEKAEPKQGAVRRILVFFGGLDAKNLNALFLKAFAVLGRDDIQVDLVLGRGGTLDQQLPFVREKKANVTIHVELPSLSELMSQADIAFGASGITTWERMCVGLPSLVITVADNQRENARFLDKNRYLKWLGDAGEVRQKDIQEALSAMLDNPLDPAWSRRCHGIVDGRGVYRTASALLLSWNSTLQARRVTASDEKLLLEWANDPDTRRNAFSTAQIGPEEHHRWFAKHLHNEPECYFYIVEDVNGVPIGPVRFQSEAEDCYEVHYGVDKIFRGRRVGTLLLRSATDMFLNDRPKVHLVARVKKNNVASRKIFENLGYERIETVNDDESLCYHLNT